MKPEKIKFRKKLLKSGFFAALAPWLIYFYVNLIGITGKWKYIGGIPDEYKGKPFIIAFWHGRLLMIPYFRPRWATIHVVMSNHRDGTIIANAQAKFGFKAIRGSSTKSGRGATDKGGVKVIRAMVQAKKNNEVVAITPDGPRGPALKVSGSTVEIAKLLEVPIIPVTYSFKNAKTAKSWDSFMLPRPFGKGVFAVGKPIMPHEADKLEVALNELTKEADIAAQSL